MENKFLPLGYAEMLERMKYKDMLERLSSTNDPAYGAEQFVSPREPGPTEKFGNLIGKGLYNLPFAFDNERSAMASGQDAATVASFTPGPGNVLGFLEGEKMAREGQPFLGTLISGLSAGIPVAGKAGNVVKPKLKTYPAPLQLPPPPPPPAPRALQHKVLHTADRPKEIKDVQGWNDGSQSEAPYRSSANLMPLRYGDNDTQMMSQIALAESDFYKKPNKVFPIENILQGMRRYGVTGKGNVNQNVDRQIGDFLSEEFVARGNATPAQVMIELQKNAPKIQETHAYYGLNRTMDDTVDTGFSEQTTKRPLFDLDSPTTTVGDADQKISQTYGERRFSMFDDGQLYGNPGSEKTSFTNNKHSYLAIGDKIGVGEKGLRDNNYMHQRYTFETIDGQENVLVGQEIQSDAYKLTRDQSRLTASVGQEDQYGGRMHVEHIVSEIGDDPKIPFEDIEIGKYTAGDALEISEDTADFHKFLKETGELDNFNTEYDEIIAKFQTEEQDAISSGNSQNSFGITDYVPEATDAYNQRAERLVSNYMPDFAKYLGIATDSKNLPRSVDWFTDSVKMLLQTGAKSDSPFVLIPNGARSLAPPSGNDLVIPPKTIPFLEKKFKNNPNIKLEYDDEGKLTEIIKKNTNEDYTINDKTYTAEPDIESKNRAKSYNDFLKKAMKQTEQDYGVKLNATEYIDGYDQEYLKIELTPELKEAFKTFRMNHGGVASLMPLKYDL